MTRLTSRLASRFDSYPIEDPETNCSSRETSRGSWPPAQYGDADPTAFFVLCYEYLLLFVDGVSRRVLEKQQHVSFDKLPGLRPAVYAS